MRTKGLVEERLVFGPAKKPFQILEALKQSTSGVSTYLGKNLETQDHVTIKTTPAELESSAYIRLLRQANLLKNTRNPFVPSFLDMEVRDQHLYLVSEYVEGISLDQLLKEGPLSPTDVCTLGCKILEALVATHAEGILHRDIKPSNIIVNVDRPIRTARLIDFGLSHFIDLESLSPNEAGGSLHYISPEQAALIDSPIDERSDLYSFGLVLFECLSGKSPFAGKDAGEILRQHLHTKHHFENLSEFRALNDFIEHLLERDPRDRYQSAEGALRDLLEISTLIESNKNRPITLGRFDRRFELTQPGFIGRADELRQVEDTLIGLKKGDLLLVAVEGESGLGKTKLLGELSRRLNQKDIRVLTGQGKALVGQLPFQVFLDVFQEITFRALNDEVFRRKLNQQLESEKEALLTIHPGFSKIFSIEGPRTPIGPEEFGEARILEALTKLFSILGTSGRPTFLFLDDFQWADELSIRFLSYWMQNARPPVFLSIVVAFRSEDVSENHPIRQLPFSTSIALKRFASSHTRDLLESMSGPLPPEAVQEICDASRGSPFMAAAILRGLVESKHLIREGETWVFHGSQENLTPSQRAITLLRLRFKSLSPEALQVLKIAAIVGKSFHFSVVTAVYGGEPFVVLNALEEASRRELIWERPNGQFVFVHDKLREELIHLTPAAEQQVLHLETAAHLDPQDWFGLAYHLDAGGQSKQAFPYALRAARAARGKSSLQLAEELYQIAFKSLDQFGSLVQCFLLRNLGQVLTLRGSYQQARKVLSRALELPLGRQTKAEIFLLMGDLAFKEGGIEEAAQSLEKALGVLDFPLPKVLQWGLFKNTLVQAFHSFVPSKFYQTNKPLTDREKILAQILSRMAYVFWFGRGRDWCAWAHVTGLNLCENYAPGPELAQSYSEHGPVMTMLPWFSRGKKYVQRSLEIRKSLGDLWGEGQSYHFLGVVEYGASEFQKTIDHCNRAISILRKTGDFWEVNTAKWHLALAQYRLGLLEESAQLAQEVFQDAIRIGDSQAAAIAVGIWSKATGGKIQPAVIESALAGCRGDIHSTAECLQGKAICALQSKNYPLAIQTLKEGLKMIEQRGFRQEYVSPLYCWHVTALRKYLETIPYYDIALQTSTFQDLKTAAKDAYRISRHFKNNLPHILREMALIAILERRPRLATRYLRRALIIAKKQDAKFEFAQTYEKAKRLNLLNSLSKTLEQLQVPKDYQFHFRETAAERESIAETIQLHEMMNIGIELLGEDSHEGFIQKVTHLVRRILNVEQALVLKVEESGKNSSQKFQVLFRSPDEPMPISDSIIQRAIQEKDAIIFDDSFDRDLSESIILQDIRSAVCIPIMIKKKVQYIACGFTRHLSRLHAEREKKLAKFLSHIISTALENQEARTTLEQSKAYYQAIIDAAPNPLLVLNAAGEIILCNQQLEKFFQYSRAELFHKQLRVLLPERYFGEQERFIKHPTVEGRDLFALRKDGVEFPVEIGTTPLHTPHGDFIICSIVDITERIRAADLLRDQRDKLQESNEELERFAYVASHDLQEPLRTVQAWCQILNEELPSSTRVGIIQESTNFIQDGARRMDLLIQALLEYSRLSRGNFHREKANIRDLAESAIQNLAQRVIDTNATIKIEGAFPTLPVSSTMVIQAFQNLIGNALKFIGDKPPLIEIGCEYSPETKSHVFYVSDNGIGIEKAHWGRIFEVFQRLHTREEYEGSGIGLSLTKKIVERHNGRLWLKSKAGEGSTFYFTLSNEG